MVCSARQLKAHSIELIAHSKMDFNPSDYQLSAMSYQLLFKFNEFLAFDPQQIQLLPGIAVFIKTGQPGNTRKIFQV